MIKIESSPAQELVSSLQQFDTPAETNLITKIQQLGTELFDLEVEISHLEDLIAAKKKEFNRIAQNELPSLFTAARIDNVGLPDRNVDVVLSTWVSAKIPEENKERAFDWLITEGHGGLIKTEVSITLGRDSLDTANEIADYLRMRYQEYETTLERGVHSQTLVSFIKSQLQESKIVPLELLGATAGSVVKFKKRKTR